MKIIFNKILYFFVLVSLSAPSFARAELWSPGRELVPCKPTWDGGTQTWTDACNFEDLIMGVSNIIDLALYLAASIAIAMFAYAGFLYLTAQDNPSKITEAHKIFKAVMFGLFFTVGAWLIVEAVLSGLGAEEYGLLGS